ncbi:MAG: tRNA (adenosine(37)-N6)-dimethylallyltransferase MiaA [Leptospiraceae bacterium]|nr:tRNA (adenosine(37)-N6)-dimethylallyltransferase MiaA [Leptospiraceae bacterium]MCP5493471.1 tRNA (adenosine(37)-N6)-dimethylallyltransferase MiaA [Leptospiraceae bacterium]
MKQNKLIILASPTGGGKTELCEHMDSDKFEIVSFDSRQVYKLLEVGTSKPNEQLRRKIKHHLIDFLEPSLKINAAYFSKLAKEKVENLLSENKIPILTCGTGFYLKAFLYGMYQTPPEIPELRTKIESLNREERWNLLVSQDKDAADAISKNDDYRVIRALEVISQGFLWSRMKERKEGGFLNRSKLEVTGIYIERDRKELYQRINLRAKEMVEGMIKETRKVVDKYGKECPALNSLGYNFALENIMGLITIEQFYERLSRSHRNYAKKQITWFKSEKILQSYSWTEALNKIKNTDKW